MGAKHFVLPVNNVNIRQAEESTKPTDNENW